MAAAPSASVLRSDKCLPVIDHSDGISVVLISDVDIHVLFPVNCWETKGDRIQGGVGGGDKVNVVFLRILGVDLDHFNNTTEVYGDKVIGMRRAISMPDILICLKGA